MKPFSFELTEVIQYQKVHHFWLDRHGYKLWLSDKEKVVYPPVKHYDDFGALLESTISKKLKEWDRLG